MPTLYTDIDELFSFEAFHKKAGRHPRPEDLTPLKKQCMLVDKNKIQWIGSKNKIPKKWKCREVSLKGKKIYPGFVECHTHLVFAGDRTQEFELRQGGASYQEISAAGGGIANTVQSTRKASLSQLVNTGLKRAQIFYDQGVRTLEAKSGYGLNTNYEIKILKAQQEIAKKMAKKMKLVSTYLGPHSKSPEFSELSDYLEKILMHDLVEVQKKKLAQRVDIFVEKGFFTKDQARKYLTTAKSMGFDLTVHAEQLSHNGGLQLAMEMGALSADHLVHARDQDIVALAKSKTTAVLLPTSDYYLKIPYPRARKMLDVGARVALATDFNPGSSPTQDLAFVGLLARMEMKMSLAEVWCAYTVSAAHALGLNHQVGCLLPGFEARFFTTEAEPSHFFYSVGSHKNLL